MFTEFNQNSQLESSASVLNAEGEGSPSSPSVSETASDVFSTWVEDDAPRLKFAGR